MTKIIKLDLYVHELMGYEKDIRAGTLSEKMRAIENGEPFKPVPVVYASESGTFYLTTIVKEERDMGLGIKLKYPVGGHHRARAHYECGKPLLCEVVAQELPPQDKASYISRFHKLIQKIPLKFS